MQFSNVMWIVFYNDPSDNPLAFAHPLRSEGEGVPVLCLGRRASSPLIAIAGVINPPGWSLVVFSVLTSPSSGGVALAEPWPPCRPPKPGAQRPEASGDSCVGANESRRAGEPLLSADQRWPRRQKTHHTHFSCCQPCPGPRSAAATTVPPTRTRRGEGASRVGSTIILAELARNGRSGERR